MIEYNGITLPDVPSNVDRNKYPYVVVANMAGIYGGYFTSKPIYYYPSDEAYMTDKGINILSFSLESGDTEWTLHTDTEESDSYLDFIASVFTPIWVDYDIINIETGEVIFASCVPKEEPKKFYYNGVLLPEFPQEYITDYHNCLILKGVQADGTEGYSILMSSNTDLFVSPSGDKFTIVAPTVMFEYDGTNDTYVNMQTISDGTMAFPLGGTGYTNISIHWSNYDIHIKDSIDDESHGIFLAASDPVPESQYIPSLPSKTLVIVEGEVLESLADEARRLNGGTTDELSVNEMVDIFKSVEISSDGSQLESAEGVGF